MLRSSVWSSWKGLALREGGGGAGGGGALVTAAAAAPGLENMQCAAEIAPWPDVVSAPEP